MLHPTHAWSIFLYFIDTMEQNVWESQLINKLPAFYAVRKFTAVLTRARSLDPILNQRNIVHILK
jgi:hypothetical protein